jgi:hypothetical protein
MRFFYLTLFLFIFYGCTETPEPVLATQTATTKILTNFTDAEDARNEYTALQEQRGKE